MYRKYKLESQSNRPSKNSSATEFQPTKIPYITSCGSSSTLNQLPVKTSSASSSPLSTTRMAGSGDTSQEILEKIRETVDHEGHGDSFVFVVLGASVSCLLYLLFSQ